VSLNSCLSKTFLASPLIAIASSYAALQCYQIDKEQRIVDNGNAGVFTNMLIIALQIAFVLVLWLITELLLLTTQIKLQLVSKTTVWSPHCISAKLSNILDNVTIDESDVLADAEIHCLLVRITFHHYCFKKLKHCLSKPLAVLFKQLLSVGHVPDDWLQASIVPVFKKGVAGQLCNYRLIWSH